MVPYGWYEEESCEIYYDNYTKIPTIYIGLYVSYNFVCRCRNHGGLRGYSTGMGCYRNLKAIQQVQLIERPVCSLG